jgi:hypothetical protein
MPEHGRDHGPHARRFSSRLKQWTIVGSRDQHLRVAQGTLKKGSEAGKCACHEASLLTAGLR